MLISPHAPVFSDYVFIYPGDVLEGDFSNFGAAGAHFHFSADTAFAFALIESLKSAGVLSGAPEPRLFKQSGITGSLDHGALVPLSFILSQYSSFKLVVISTPAMDRTALLRIGTCIRLTAQTQKRNIVVVASGDLSHRVNVESPYGMVSEGAEFDSIVCEAIAQSSAQKILSIDNDLREAAAECGYGSMVIMIGALGTELASKLISYEAPFGIGYGVASFCGLNKDPDLVQPSYPVQIARTTLEKLLSKKPMLELDTLQLSSVPDELTAILYKTTAGVFVSIKKNGELRGCIGTISATCPTVAQEIARNSCAAATDDPRFPPVCEEELPFLSISVDILSPAEEITTTNELDPSVYGVIVTSGYRRGLLLPNLAGVDTVEQQLAIACQKAGITPDSPYRIERFRVTRYN